MIVYEMTDTINRHMSQGQVVVSNVTAKNNKLVVEIHDKSDDRYAQIVFENPQISQELFDINGQLVAKLAVYRFESYYSVKQFIGADITIANASNVNQTITITGSSSKGE